jgi:predicted CXXCH cytochrome family protein
VAALRFPHAAAAHAQLACTACHAEADVRSGKPARPGARDHAPCDQSGCHAQAFVSAPGELCSLCHDEVAPWQPGGTTLAPYPPQGPLRSAASEFSHALHLDKDKMEAATGFHVACIDCHARANQEPDYGAPEHDACARCHDDPKHPGVPARLRECRACHRADVPPIPRARVLVHGDVRFGHAEHEADRAGRGIACVECHREIGRSARVDRLATPEMEVCVSCHDDPKRTPETMAISACPTCHDRPSALGLDIFGIAPRSHLPPRDKPDSHTLAFRKDHGPEARRDPLACARCHGGMSGRRENCDECHMVMRPADHIPAWAELMHGSDAATDAQRCATCHQGDFCTTCHARTPRSHEPLPAWTDGRSPGHAFPARQNLRSCLTCHRFEDTCLRCHERRP